MKPITNFVRFYSCVASTYTRTTNMYINAGPVSLYLVICLAKTEVMHNLWALSIEHRRFKTCEMDDKIANKLIYEFRNLMHNFFFLRTGRILSEFRM